MKRYVLLVIFGWLIAAELIKTPVAHADPKIDAQITCAIIDADQTPAGVVKSIKNLGSLGYNVDTATSVFVYAINNVCPKYIDLVQYTMKLTGSESIKGNLV